MPVDATHDAPAPAIGALARMSAFDLLKGYRKRKFSPTEVLEEVIDALAQTDVVCNVMVEPMFDSARTAARSADQAWMKGEPGGALCGVPVTVKDLIYVADVPARGGAPAFENFVPKADAAVVESLRRAGAVLTCKTTTCESGYKLTADSPITGVTRNPWRLSRTSGGSSGGAAAAVAAGCGPLAVGTDGVGSIRVPSSFCGVVGIKPTFGLVPRAPGFFPPSWASLAHTGPIARNVRDVATLLETISGYDLRDAASLHTSSIHYDSAPGRLNGLRIACSVDLGFAQVATEVRAAFEDALKALRTLGAETMAAEFHLDADIIEGIIKPIAYTEQAAAAIDREAAVLDRSDPEYRAVLKRGRGYLGVDYIGAMHRRTQLRSKFLKLFESASVLVTPTVAVPAFSAGTLGVDKIEGETVDQHLGWSPFTWPINLVGLPAATLPCGYDRDGMPIGLQIVAPWLCEQDVFRVASALEAEFSFQNLWPGFTP